MNQTYSNNAITSLLFFSIYFISIIIILEENCVIFYVNSLCLYLQCTTIGGLFSSEFVLNT